MRKISTLVLLCALSYSFQACSVQNQSDEFISSVSGLKSRPSNSTCLAPPGAPDENQLIIERIFPNLNFEFPTVIIPLPNNPNTFYITEQTGKIFKIQKEGDEYKKILFLDISGRILGPDVSPELGLVGMVLHVGFQNNGKVYIFYTSPIENTDYSTCDLHCPTRIKVSQFTVPIGEEMIDPNSEKNILTTDLPWAVHHAGTMHFGKDGYLYISLGDGEGDWDKFPVSQDTNTLDGSILRIDIDNGDPYSIPPDNPFFNGGGLPEIFAWGFRNPWRWSFDRLTGDIWVGDVGLARWEEINLVKPGLNYGWPIFEGFECLLGPCDTENFTFPIWTYFHDEGCAVIGGYVYRGTNISELFGVYLYSDICSGTVWGLFPDSTSGYNNKLLSNSGLNISSFAEDQNGEIYISDYYGGGIYKIVGHKPDSEIGPSIPSLLSKTGCFHTDNPKIPLTGLIPYVVNAPLWSDSAEKHRWMALPDDEKVRIGDDGKWIFPVGTVLVKNFLIDSKLIETRLLMQHQEEVWAGYSYEWNEEQTEAFLVDSLGKARQLSSGQTWWYPSRSQCLRCHTKAAGRVLGLETAQMNRLFKYPETDIPANQIRTLSFIGVLDQEFTAEEIKALPSFPLQDGIFPPEDQIAENARVYLHVNCSMCHRPKGPGVGPEDFRYETPLYQMGACDIDPTVSNLGIADAKLLFPGEPEKSIIWHRMNSIDENRMPPLATSIIDQYGVNLIGEWISSMDDCLGP